MKLNWLSPLAPARSAIASYTGMLLPHLARHADLTLWTDQTDYDPRLERHARIRRYDRRSMPWADLNRADLTVYQIGNHGGFHGPIWEISRRHSGFVILHDLRLHDLFLGHFRQCGDRDGYIDAITRCHGATAAAEARELWVGRRPIDYMGQRFPMTELASDNALGVLVHTHESLSALSRAPRQPLACTPLPYPVTAHEAARARPGGTPHRLIIFGHLGWNRRVEIVLEALATLPERAQFHLDVYGEVENTGQLETRIAALQLAPLVTLHGFVSDAQLDHALRGADLALNLRFPTMGEASYSQLQIWNAALPSLVSRAGWYATLPEEAVAFVRPEHEQADVQMHLRAYLADPRRFTAMGESGRRRLEKHHTPQRYVEALMRFLHAAMDFRTRAAAWQLGERAAGEIGNWAEANAPRAIFGRMPRESCRLAGIHVDEENR